MNTNLRIILGQCIQVLLQQDILLGDIGENEVHLGVVASSSASHDGFDDLQHGSNTGSTSDHTKAADHVRGVNEGALGSLDFDSLANFEGGHELGDVALWVRLDEEIKETGLVISRDRSIGSNNIFVAAVFLLDGGANGNVLADRETEDRFGGGELEAVTVRGRCAC